jgi:uncharacterized iron-regulated membrane protein
VTDVIDTPTRPAAPAEPVDHAPEVVRDRPVRSKGDRWWQDGLKPLLLRLHFYVGIFVGPFILVAALTGLLYTLTPQLEQVAHRRELTVPVGTTTVPLADQLAAAQLAVPEGTLTEVRPPIAADRSTRVTFDTPDVDDDHARTAFVDPYTGEVRGVLTTFGEWLPVRSWFDSLHRTLLLGEVGRLYSELAASWLWVLALSGLGLWIARGRRRHRLRRTLLPETKGRGRGRLLTWHGAVGLWAAVGMLFLSATGLTWSQFAGDNVGRLRSQLDWTAPTVTTALSPGSPSTGPAGQPGAAAERVLLSARGAGLDGPVKIIPGDAGSAWKVSQAQRSWPARQDSVAVDPATGQILDRVDFADWPLAAKLARWGIDAHMGLLFGPVNQVLLAALAVGLICMIGWGYRMWWHRRPTRDQDRRFATHPAGSRRPGRIATMIVATAGLAVGLFFPLLGGSLLIFVLFDAVRTTIRRT